MLNGKQATVKDLQPGARLHRTALRIVENASFEAE
jgi:hypothetical protein